MEYNAATRSVTLSGAPRRLNTRKHTHTHTHVYVALTLGETRCHTSGMLVKEHALPRAAWLQLRHVRAAWQELGARLSEHQVGSLPLCVCVCVVCCVCCVCDRREHASSCGVHRHTRGKVHHLLGSNRDRLYGI